MQNKYWQRSISSALIISMLLVSVGVLYPPQPAHAVLNSVRTCSISVAKNVLSRLIASAVAYWAGNRYISLFGGPQPTESWVLNVKAGIFDGLERCAARILHDSMIAGMLDVVRKEGRDGGQSYVKNWRNFMTSAEHRGENIGKIVVANTELCGFFKNDIRTALGISGRDNADLSGQNTRSGGMFDSFPVRGGCSMPAGFSLDNLQNDFSGNGGWGAISMLNRPENNFFESYLSAKEEIDQQRAMEVQSDYLDAAVTGKGYTALRGKTADSSCKLRGLNGKCLVYQDIKSPGSYSADVVGATINSEMRWVDNVHSIGDIVAAALVDRVVARLENLGNEEEASTEQAQPIPLEGGGCVEDNPRNPACYAQLPTLQECQQNPNNLLCGVEHPPECVQVSDSTRCIVYLPRLDIWPQIQANNGVYQ